MIASPIVDLMLGNTVYLNLRLRKRGVRGGLNVSSAQRIAVEFARNGEPPLAPVLASRTAAGADWIAGKVPVLVSPADLTARVGTYDVTVTVFDTPTEITATLGRVEVLPRPIAGALNLPAGGSYTATNVISATNVSPATILAGAPVARTPTGVVLANAGLQPLQADGVCIASTGPGATCLYISNGTVSFPDWSPLFGGASLPVGSTFYLSDTPGMITTDLPDLPDYKLRQVIGETDVDPLKLYLSLDYSVGL